MHILDERRNKLDSKSEALTLSRNHPSGAYKLYNLVKQQIVINKDVIVEETTLWNWKSQFGTHAFMYL